MAGNISTPVMTSTTESFLFTYEVSNMDPNMSTNTTFRNHSYRPMVFKSPPLSMEDILTIPLYSLIFILSVVGNLLVIITLIQNKRMRTVTNVFLLNLSMSDLLLAVFCMPFTIIPVMLKNFIFGATVCVLIRYLQGNTDYLQINSSFQCQRTKYEWVILNS